MQGDAGVRGEVHPPCIMDKHHPKHSDQTSWHQAVWSNIASHILVKRSVNQSGQTTRSYLQHEAPAVVSNAAHDIQASGSARHDDVIVPSDDNTERVGWEGRRREVWTCRNWMARPLIIAACLQRQGLLTTQVSKFQPRGERMHWMTCAVLYIAVLRGDLCPALCAMQRTMHGRALRHPCNALPLLPPPHLNRPLAALLSGNSASAPTAHSTPLLPLMRGDVSATPPARGDDGPLSPPGSCRGLTVPLALLVMAPVPPVLLLSERLLRPLMGGGGGASSWERCCRKSRVSGSCCSWSKLPAAWSNEVKCGQTWSNTARTHSKGGFKLQ